VVGDNGITVSDNGPGIPPDVVERVIDLDVRVSSRAGYLAPDRGAQGNALKTVIAIPFALDGDRGEIKIEGHRVRHRITITLDRVRQQPRIEHEREDLVRNGSLVRLRWPARASSILHDAEWRFLQVARDFTVLNPHVSMGVDWFGETVEFAATNSRWRKWTPSDPTSAHWYTVDDLARLRPLPGRGRARRPCSDGP
jgi:DNA topoisomerase VI subunit B